MLAYVVIIAYVVRICNIQDVSLLDPQICRSCRKHRDAMATEGPKFCNYGILEKKIEIIVRYMHNESFYMDKWVFFLFQFFSNFQK